MDVLLYEGSFQAADLSCCSIGVGVHYFHFIMYTVFFPFHVFFIFFPLFLGIGPFMYTVFFCFFSSFIRFGSDLIDGWGGIVSSVSGSGIGYIRWFVEILVFGEFF